MSATLPAILLAVIGVGMMLIALLGCLAHLASGQRHRWDWGPAPTTSQPQASDQSATSSLDALCRRCRDQQVAQLEAELIARIQQLERRINGLPTRGDSWNWLVAEQAAFYQALDALRCQFGLPDLSVDRSDCGGDQPALCPNCKQKPRLDSWPYCETCLLNDESLWEDSWPSASSQPQDQGAAT